MGSKSLGDEWLGDVRARWPGQTDALQEFLARAVGPRGAFDLPPERFLTFALARLPGGELAPGLRALAAADLYLCCASLEGLPPALKAFDRLFVATVEPALVRLGVSPTDRQDLAQQQRIKLLVGAGERGPALASYAGRGSLAGWLRAAAVRAAHNARRQQAPLAPEGPPEDAHEDGWAAWAAVADDPELGHLKQAYCDAFRRAADAAFAALSPRSRLLLKQHLLDEISPPLLATFYGVHQATVYRWLDAARGELVADTRHRLARELCLDDGEIARLMTLLQSQLEVSVRRLLALGQ